MKLFYSPASPFVRKVMIVLHETGLLAETEIVRVSGNAVDPGTMPVDANPLGKIPTLLLDDGGALYDSRVITRYLGQNAGGTLYPTGARHWEVLTTEATGDGIADAAILCVYERRLRPDPKVHEPWVDGQWAKVSRALDHLDTKGLAALSQGFDIGQVAVAAALGYLDFRLSARNWRDGRPELAAWFAKVSARPSLQATIPTD